MAASTNLEARRLAHRVVKMLRWTGASDLKAVLMRALIAALLIWPVYANAQFMSGNEIYGECSNSDRDFINGFTAGILDTIDTDNQTSLQVCTPEGVTIGQARDVMCQYLKNNPNSRNQAAASLGWVAFYDAWPCPR